MRPVEEAKRMDMLMKTRGSSTCYYCGHFPCICEYDKVSMGQLRKDVIHAMRNGRKYDRDALTWGELRTLLRRLDRLARRK